MKRLLILAFLVRCWAAVAGCRFMDCLCRGPSCQQTTAPPVTYAAPYQPSPCQASPCPCEQPCGGGQPVVIGPGQ